MRNLFPKDVLPATALLDSNPCNPSRTHVPINHANFIIYRNLCFPFKTGTPASSSTEIFTTAPSGVPCVYDSTSRIRSPVADSLFAIICPNLGSTLALTSTDRGLAAERAILVPRSWNGDNLGGILFSNLRAMLKQAEHDFHSLEYLSREAFNFAHGLRSASLRPLYCTSS